MASQPRKLHKSPVPGSVAAAVERQEIYILVMGLTGAGKSTFISIATEDPSVPIGDDDDMDGGAFTLLAARGRSTDPE